MESLYSAKRLLPKYSFFVADRGRTLRHHARAMRHFPTRAEDRVWSWLRDRRCSGLKFRRQVPIAGYIADFYCAEIKLAIELDGAHHSLPWISDYDGQRTVRLASVGIRILRIPNELLIRDSMLAGEQIRATIPELLVNSGKQPNR